MLAPSPELGPLPEDDDEDNDFIVDLDEILAAATHEEAAEQEQAGSLKSADSLGPRGYKACNMSHPPNGQHVAWTFRSLVMLCIQHC